MKSAALQSAAKSFANQLFPAIDEPRNLRSIFQRAARDVVVIRLVRLAEIGGVAVRDRPLLTHPMNSRARVEPPGESDADSFADRQRLKDICHLGLSI